MFPDQKKGGWNSSVCVYVYMYMHVCTCMCVCVCVEGEEKEQAMFMMPTNKEKKTHESQIQSLLMKNQKATKTSAFRCNAVIS